MSTNANDTINKVFQTAIGVAKQLTGHITGDDEMYRKGLEEREAALGKQSDGANTSSWSNATMTASSNPYAGASSSSYNSTMPTDKDVYNRTEESTSVVDTLKNATATTVQSVKNFTGLGDQESNQRF